jgi:hypothetical protein
MPHTPPRRGPTAEGFNTPTEPGARLIVEYADTADMPDGQPLPPYIDDDVVWHAVCPIPGARMLWRRIRLSSETLEHAIDRRPVALTFNAWRQSRHQN